MKPFNQGRKMTDILLLLILGVLLFGAAAVGHFLIGLGIIVIAIITYAWTFRSAMALLPYIPHIAIVVALGCAAKIDLPEPVFGWILVSPFVLIIGALILGFRFLFLSYPFLI
jgi:hypothetical protein